VNAASVAGTSLEPASISASTTASSSTIAAPAASVGGGAWTASPMRTVR
jgi:hypothetical protein